MISTWDSGFAISTQSCRLSFSKDRMHHADISFGAWKLYLNGIQFFAGRYSLMVAWPVEWFQWKKN